MHVGLQIGARGTGVRENWPTAISPKRMQVRQITKIFFITISPLPCRRMWAERASCCSKGNTVLHDRYLIDNDASIRELMLQYGWTTEKRWWA